MTPSQQLQARMSALPADRYGDAIEAARNEFFQLVDEAVSYRYTFAAPTYDPAANRTQCIASAETRDLFWALYVSRHGQLFIATGDIP